MTDELRRAYTVLGLAPATFPWTVKRRYRALVKRWHPDQFTGDPAAQAVAAQRMSEINGAYRTIKQAALGRLSPRRRAPPAPPPGPRPSAGVRSGTRGYSDVEDWFESVFWYLGALRNVIAGVFAFGCAVALVVALMERDLQTLRSNPQFVAVPLLAGLGAALYLVERKAGRSGEGSRREATVEQSPNSGDRGKVIVGPGVFYVLIGLVLLGWEFSSDHRLRAKGGAWGRGGFSRIDVMLLILGWIFSLLGFGALIRGDGSVADERSRKAVFVVGILLGLVSAYWLGAYEGLTVDLLVEWAPLFVILGLVVAWLRWTQPARPPDS